MSCANLEDLFENVECMTCCRPFSFALYQLFHYIACPHCGAHYLPLHDGRTPSAISTICAAKPMRG